MTNKEAIQILNDALNLANSKGVFGQLQNSAIVNTAFTKLLSKYEEEVNQLNEEALSKKHNPPNKTVKDPMEEKDIINK